MAEEFIPGLPDGVAMDCLVRVPSQWHGRMNRVCSGWRGAVRSAEFQRRRQAVGAEEDVVLVVQPSAPPAGGAVSAVANLTTGEWRRVEGQGPLPQFAQCAAAGDGRHVAVVGGWDPDTFCPTRDVRVLDVAAGAWHRGQPMPDSRTLFGCAGGGDGNVYVAGGHDDYKNALRSAFAYCVEADAWRALPDMSEERDEPQLVAVPGLGVVLAASGYTTAAQGVFKNTAECYAGGGDAWTSEGHDAAAAAGTTCLASVRGSLWAVGAGNGGVRAWDVAARAWRGVADGPPGMEACVKAVGIGDGASVFVFGTVQADAALPGRRHAAWVMDAATAAWRRVPVPPGFDGVVYSAAVQRV